MFEKGFELARTLDAGVDLLYFGVCYFSPGGSDGSVVSQAAEKNFNLCQGKAHVAGEADEQQTVEGVAGGSAADCPYWRVPRRCPTSRNNGWRKPEDRHLWLVLQSSKRTSGGLNELFDLKPTLSFSIWHCR